MEALLHEARTLARIKVTEREFILVSEQWGFGVDESPRSVCYCGTCFEDMERFALAIKGDAVLFCRRCGLRVFVPEAVIMFPDILSYYLAKGEDVVEREICGRCFGAKYVQVEVHVGNGAKKIEFHSCPVCRG